ncbi:hypothetical protein [Actinomyces sp. MRS3W]|uniref:hypothetical protein n=1 Tax=Actinomyces sp. MRS3W TaxID=2800796 RepID=UPI0028FD33A5|nr:hypothetical protein [Actinomyces sp. MRS3W]MDU0349234.1 hypothetical protein [Actinomyces sp. MRS3W]
MGRVKFRYSVAGFSALRRGSEARAAVTAAARVIAARAGEGFDVEERVGGSRARAYVKPTTPEARQAAADHALERAAGGGV